MIFSKESFVKIISKIFSDKKNLLIFLFSLSILISIAFLLFLGSVGPAGHSVPGGDYNRLYEPLADSFINGKGLILNNNPIIISPGYPIILAKVFIFSEIFGINRLDGIVFFNILISALSACILFLIAESLFSKKIALFSSILWMSYPFNLWFLKNPNTEVPFILFLLLGIFFYILTVKKKKIGFAFLSGITLALASLIRAVSLIFPIVLIFFIFVFLKKDSIKIKFLLILMLIVGFLITILPWEIYVFSETQKIIPLSSHGFSTIGDGLTFALREGEGGDRVNVSKDVLGLMKRAELTDLETSGQVFNFLIKELINSPIPLFKLIILKLGRSWYATFEMWWEWKILLAQLVYLIPGLLGLIMVFKKHKDKILNAFFILGIIFYFWFMTVMAVSILRYMVPIMGFVIIFAVIFIEHLFKKLFPNSKLCQNLFQ